jgi:hypothetical protein
MSVGGLSGWLGDGRVCLWLGGCGLWLDGGLVWLRGQVLMAVYGCVWQVDLGLRDRATLVEFPGLFTSVCLHLGRDPTLCPLDVSDNLAHLCLLEQGE